ncbi:kinesin light chain-like [Wyeomyia smithii]|uniref:kinesin light chain-like n=1 Tax=Wyeomyia smithii TaxID=174621 RepID=UPI002467CC01|nr:kinesin light chain-like [Wyeomyia smithii]
MEKTEHDPKDVQTESFENIELGGTPNGFTQAAGILPSQIKDGEYQDGVKGSEEPPPREEFIAENNMKNQHNCSTNSKQFTIFCNPCERLQTLTDFIIRYASQGWETEALSLCFQVLKDLEKDSSCPHPSVEAMLNGLTIEYIKQNRCKAAVDLLNQVLMIQKKILGEGHIGVRATLKILASLHEHLAIYENAESLSKSMLEVQETVFGKTHAVVAKQLNRMALICLNLGKYEEAELYYQRASRKHELQLDSGDIDVAEIEQNLEKCNLMRSGNFDESEIV